ncbi:MAG: MBOAT family protein, partial [Agathobacter sp.]|nr:MBOAT family protein [Agathobacter sp.]
NIFVVWMLTGLWHGAEWNFVLWGVYFGVFLLLEKFILLKWLNKIPRVFRHIYTLFVVLVSWAIFAITDMGQLVDYLKTMFGGGAPLWDGKFLYYIRTNGILLILLVICSLDYKTWLKNHPKVQAVVNSRGVEVARIAIMLVLMVVSFSFLVGDSYNPFLYFRF